MQATLGVSLRMPDSSCNHQCMSEQTNSLLDPEWDVADRMKKALRVADIGVQEMADYLGVARNTVSTWINGRITPSKQTLRLWSLRCGVRYEWLANDARPQPVRAEASSLPRLDSNQQPADCVMSLAGARFGTDELAARRERRWATRRCTPRPFGPFRAIPVTAAL